MTAVFPMVATPFWSWIRQVADGLRTEAFNFGAVERASSSPKRLRSDYKPGTIADSISNRATALERCVRSIVGWVCPSGRPAEGDAQLQGAHGAHLCHSRACPRCSRIRSAQLQEWGGELQKHLLALRDTADGEAVDYRLRLITLTDEYNPSDEADLTVDALRRRVRGLRDAWRRILSRVRSTLPKAARKLVGAWVAVEMAGTGHVHVHVLFFGPWVDLPQWVAWGREVYARLGDIADVRIADFDAIAQLAHYPCKSPGGAATRWLAGGAATGVDGRPVLSHPILVARWEVALFGARIGDRYGSFRSVRAPDEVVVTDRNARPPEPCPCCGSTDWKRVKCSISDWVRTCDRHGVERHLGTPRAVIRRE